MPKSTCGLAIELSLTDVEPGQYVLTWTLQGAGPIARRGDGFRSWSGSSGGAWRPEAYIKASNADAFDRFGGALTMSRDGRTMVVGA